MLTVLANEVDVRHQLTATSSGTCENTGQISVQAPHSVQSWWSMRGAEKMSSWMIAPTGQEPTAGQGWF
jgi:hypothetical protein